MLFDDYYNKLNELLKTQQKERADKLFMSILKRYPREDIPQKLFALFESSEKTAPEKKVLNILFLQDSPCIRNYKYAQSLKKLGHKVSLAYLVKKLSERYPGLSDDVYQECFKIKDLNELWALSKKYDIIHSHNEPDQYTVAALAGHCPVIHDTHDLVSLRDYKKPEMRYFEGIANRAAHGRIYSTPYQRDEAKAMYQVEGDSLVVYNYASAEDIPDQFYPKASAQDGFLHMVYEGGVGGSEHRSFTQVFIDIAQAGVKLHIFPARYDDKIAQELNAYPNIDYRHPVSPKEIIKEMSRYDIGIIPWNLNELNERFLSSTIANKLFEYFAAGLPVATADITSYRDYFKSHPVGITFKSVPELLSQVPYLLRLKDNIDFKKLVFTYDQEIHKVVDYYYQVIERNQIGETEHTIHKDNQTEKLNQCPICKSHEVKELRIFDQYSLFGCTQCLVKYINPMPDIQFLKDWYSSIEYGKRWSNNLDKAIEKNHEQNVELNQIYFDFISRFVPLKSIDSVLEIGCYSGQFLKFFKDINKQCIGTDFNEYFVNYGKKNFGLDLRTGDLTEQKFANEQFDIVIFNQVLEHLHEPHQFISEVNRVTKDGGYICLSVPNSGSLSYELKDHFTKDHYTYVDYPNHLFYYQKKSFEYLFPNDIFIPILIKDFSTKEILANTDISIHDFKDCQDHESVNKLLSEKLNLLIKDLSQKDNVEKSGLFCIFRKKNKIAINYSSDNYHQIDVQNTQWLKNHEIKQLQNMMLKDILKRVNQNSKYYEDLFRKYNVCVSEVNDIDDLKALPILTKDIILKNYDLLLHKDIKKVKAIPTGTGGSTGQSLQYYINKEVEYFGLNCRNRGFSWAGFDIEHDKVVFFAGGSLGVKDSIEIKDNKLYLPIIGVSHRESLFRYYEEMKRFEAQFMRTYPSGIYLFCKFLNEEHLELKFKSVVCTSEMLYDYQREYIEATLKCKVFNEYGAYDGGVGAFECEYHHLHLQSERGIIEILNDDDQPVHAGEMGRIICTDLHNDIFPFIRYEVGDLAILSDKECLCGRGLPVIERLEGRSSDYIVLADGTRHSGVSVLHLFNKILQSRKADIREYQVIQKKDYSVNVKIVPGKTFNTEQSNVIKEAFHDHLPGLSINIELCDEIKVSPSGKRRFVYNELDQLNDDKRTAVKRKPKVCHIGGAHSVHMTDIVEELDQLGYDQFIISYMPIEKSISPKHIKVYYYPFRDFLKKDFDQVKFEMELLEFLKNVIKTEKPDIIHGHSLTYSSAALWLIKEFLNIPISVTPWSTSSIKNPEYLVNYYEEKCLSVLDYLFHGMPKAVLMFKAFYKNVGTYQYQEFRTMMPFEHYQRRREISHDVKILSVRVMGENYKQDLLIKSLPSLIQKAPGLKVTFLIGQDADQGRKYFEQMKTLAQELGVSSYCHFVDRSLSQAELADMIYSHSIVYCIATHDEGFSVSATVSMYSGAICIVQETEENEDLIDKKHLLKVQINQSSIQDTLIYAIEHLEELQQRFMIENQYLIKYSKEKMIQNLMNAYEDMYACIGAQK